MHITFSNESLSFVSPGWEALQELAFNMAKDIRNSELQFDRVVTLAKGGWPMSRSLADFLEISEVQSLGLKFYKGIDERMAKPVIYQDLPVNVSGESILLFDDVADTGESLAFAMEYLTRRGAAQITTACIYYKERSRVKPDFYAQQVEGWIVFPYELLETLRVLGTKWLSEGVDPEEVVARFVQFRFPEKQIRYLLEEVLLT